ncbi:MAG TPA: papain-like cysteine protease family protein [Vicinamibacterales bacterium]|nr:papain-like cysteine protease family protein [Vicinamibacterales bacterium]
MNLRRASSVVALSITLIVAPAPAQAQAQANDARGVLIDVPYLTQTEALCGGAALAMVMRYWGERDVFAEDFASLVDRDARGIHTSRLLDAARGRGWRATEIAPGAKSLDAMRDALRRGQPVLALIEDRPNALHFVVVAGANTDSVVVHDPARAPYRVMKVDEFEKRSAAADRWMAIVLPNSGSEVAPPTTRSQARTARVAASSSAPCTGLVDQAVGLADRGEDTAAEQQLLTATSMCADAGAPWRELAGLRFKQQRYDEARDLAEHATTLAPDDAIAWQLLATSRYLTDDTVGALHAWQKSEPLRVGVVSVVGAERIDHPVVVEQTGLEPRETLTPDIYWRAKRRLDDLPALSSAAIVVEPGADGFATVRAVVDEDPVFPTGMKSLGSIGVKAIFSKELGAKVSGLLKQGETIGAAWRWSPHRQRIRAEFALPAPGVLPGVASLDGLWEVYTFTPSGVPLGLRSDGDFVMRRRRVMLHLSDWSRGWLHWNVGGGVDRFATTTTAAADAAVDLRFDEDRLAFGVAGSLWSPMSGDNTPAFSATTVMGAWRSTARPAAPVLMAYGGATLVSDDAPIAIWQGAGTADNRPALLRAHRLHRGGVIDSEAIGRRLLFGTVEYARPIYSRSIATVALAGFVDLARNLRRAESSLPSRWLVDIGGGLRIHTGSTGAVRLDFAFSPRDRRRAFSAGYVTAWPRLFSGAW